MQPTFYNAFPDEDMTVLVDYFGKEVTDTLEVCNFLRSMQKKENFL